MANDPYESVKNPEKVLSLVSKFIEDQGITVPETIYQNDKIIEDAYEFIEALCEAAGYAEGEDDEDEDITDFGYDEDNPFGEDDEY